MSVVESYRAAKQRAARALLADANLIGYVTNRHVVQRVAEEGGGRDEMFALGLQNGRLTASIDIGHDYEGCPATSHDEEGRTLQSCRLTVKASWRALEKASPIVALEQAHFHAKVAEVACTLERSFGESGVVWEVIMEAPARVSRAAAA